MVCAALLENIELIQKLSVAGVFVCCQICVAESDLLISQIVNCGVLEMFEGAELFWQKDSQSVQILS